MERIRLALVITELDVGGAERCLVNLATRLDRGRFEPFVYCLGPRPQDDRLVRRLALASVPVEFLNARTAWQLPRVIRELGRHFCALRPALVQAFLFHANVVASLASRGLKECPVVFGIRVADPARWRIWVETHLARSAARIVCVSSQIAQDWTRRINQPAKVARIPNGIDIADLDAAEALEFTRLGIPADRRLLLFVGRLHRQKGLDWFLPHCPALFADLPQHDLVIVGDGPERGKLVRQAASLGISQRVHFLGWRPDVPSLLKASEILVLPSRWEGMPNVVLEAMAARRPVVCTRVSGTEELLGESSPWQAAPLGDVAGFLERLHKLADDRPFAVELGERNRERLESQFTLAAMVAQYETLYESLVRGDLHG